MTKTRKKTPIHTQGANDDVTESTSKIYEEATPAEPITVSGRAKPPPVRFRRLAEREASWFFRALGGHVPETGDAAVRRAAEQMQRWLRALPAFHRGALQLRYVPRIWPAGVAHEFGELTSVAVRLECAMHPAVGLSVAAVESASVARLAESIQRCERARARRAPRCGDAPVGPVERELARLAHRAERHVALAIDALARVRGRAPFLVPGGGAR